MSDCGRCRVETIVRSLVSVCSVEYERYVRNGWPVHIAAEKRTLLFCELWPGTWPRIQDAMRPRWQFWKRVAR